MCNQSRAVTLSLRIVGYETSVHESEVKCLFL